MKRILFLLAGVIALGGATIASFGPASGADHGDAPLAKDRPQLDINDVYVFEGSDGDVVFAVTVNPLTMPGDAPVFATESSGALYQIKIDNDGDARADLSYNVTFGIVESDGSQDVVVRAAVNDDAEAISGGGTLIVEGSTTPGNNTPQVAENGTAQLFAGVRDDPFFFDLNAFRAGLAFRDPGNNFFAGLNVSAIVLQVPAEEFGASATDTTAGVWAVTSRDGSVIDRMGRPAINTVFIPAEEKDAFNQTAPFDDRAQWRDTVVAALTELGSDPALADALLPDILTFDSSLAFGFLNGRQLQDDVIDAELQLITGDPAASDFVDNDSTFLTGFPYLGVPNTAAAPTPVPAASPTVAAPAPAPTTPGGTVTAPDTGSGPGGGSDAMLWLAGAVALAALLAGGAGTFVRIRNR